MSESKQYSQPVQEFLEHLKFEKRYSVHTLLAYETDLTGFFDYLEIQYGSSVPAEVTHSMIRSWLASLKDAEQSSRSIRRKISSLRSFFKFELRQGHIEQSPMGKVVSPKISKRLPNFVQETEMVPLLKTLELVSEDWDSLNTWLMVGLFYSTGMRLSELLGLKIGHVDRSRKQIKVLGKGNKERSIPVKAETIADIDRYEQLKAERFPEGNEFLLITAKGKKMYPRYAYGLIHKALGAVPTLEQKSPHVLRHTFATHLVNQGAELNAVKDLLGHSSLAATQVYTHNTIEKLKDVYKKAHPRG